MPHETPDETPARRPAAGPFLRAHATNHRRRVLECLALTLALGLTEWVGLLLLVPLLALVGLRDEQGTVGRLADTVARSLAAVGVRPTLLPVLVLFVALVGARALLQRRETIASSALEQEVVLRLRRRLYTAVAHARWVFFSRQRLSDFTHALTNDVDRVGLATSQLLRLVGEVAIGVAYLALALRISPVMTALAAACGVSLLALLRGWNTRARHAGESLGATSADLFGAIHEHLGGMKTARSYGAEDRNAGIFVGLAERLAASYVRASGAYATSNALFSVGSAMVLAVFVYVAVAVLRLPTTAVLLLLLVFSRLVPRFSSALSGFQHFATALPAYGNVIGMIERCEAEAEPRAAAVQPVELRDAVRLCDVSFRYRPDGEARTLDALDVEIPVRRTTAIVGPSGAGKSTVADLVLGLLTPESGSVSVDGAPLTPERAQGWRERVGYVPQDTFLLHDTVRANLLWARPEATEEDLWLSLGRAAARGFVEHLPSGLDTVIGDRGVLLSGGERQRLALARALLRRPTLLILDEATSALDSENERHIQRAITELHGRMTILVITHRLSTIRDADVIHVLEHGRLVESGTWGALLAGEIGRFRALCAAQGIHDEAPVA